MKGFKKFIPIIVLFLVFLIGLILLTSVPTETNEFGTSCDVEDDNYWTYLGMVIIGFYGNVIYIAWLVNRIKKEKKRLRDEAFEKSIRQAFVPVANNTSKEENKKITCKYCKSKYDKNESKCPNCGAPPEPCD